MQEYLASELTLLPDNYCGPHGWSWQPHSIAKIVAKAFATSLGEKCLPNTRIWVDDLVKTPAGYPSRGSCHDTNYSIVVRVTSTWGHNPSPEEVYNAYRGTNADFKVEAIHGGYHFYKTW